MENESKQILRREILKKRGLLSSFEREKAAMLLTDRILGHQWYYLSDTLLGFASYGSEINLDFILTDALEKGKKLFLPKVEGEQLVFYRVEHLEELEIGYKGIREPVGNTEKFQNRTGSLVKHTLMLIPGVAFDKERNRMGYGKGFYDRYLEDKPDLLLRTIGVGYKMQLLDKIPCEKFDKKPYQVICL